MSQPQVAAGASPPANRLWIVCFGALALALALSFSRPSQPVVFAEGVWWLAPKVIAGVLAAGLLPMLILLGATARGRWVVPLVAGALALLNSAIAAACAAELINHRYSDPVPQWVEVTVESKSAKTTSRGGLHHAFHVRSAAGVLMSIPVEKSGFQAMQVGTRLRVAVHTGYLGRNWGSTWMRVDA